MAMRVDDIISGVIDREKGYVNHPNDKGGPTKYGITQVVARKWGYQGDMRDLPLALARQILYNDYVIAPKLDKILAINEPIAAEMVDTCVNMGQKPAIQFLQRSLNGLASDSIIAGGRLVVDGILGTKSFTTLTSYLKSRPNDGERNVLKMLNCLQGSEYLRQVEANVKQKDFINGWIAQRVEI